MLYVDEDKMRNTKIYENNPEYIRNMINTMYDFIELIEYCAEHDDVNLIFG